MASFLSYIDDTSMMWLTQTNLDNFAEFISNFHPAYSLLIPSLQTEISLSWT